jgi:hypothetical protein
MFCEEVHDLTLYSDMEVDRLTVPLKVLSGVVYTLTAIELYIYKEVEDRFSPDCSFKTISLCFAEPGNGY